MPTHDNLSNGTLHGNWHLLVEMKARIREINSTVFREYFIVVWLIFSFLFFIVILEVFNVPLVLYSLS
jgi:hypothetical protein